KTMSARRRVLMYFLVFGAVIGSSGGMAALFLGVRTIAARYATRSVESPVRSPGIDLPDIAVQTQVREAPSTPKAQAKGPSPPDPPQKAQAAPTTPRGALVRPGENEWLEYVANDDTPQRARLTPTGIALPDTPFQNAADPKWRVINPDGTEREVDWVWFRATSLVSLRSVDKTAQRSQGSRQPFSSRRTAWGVHC